MPLFLDFADPVTCMQRLCRYFAKGFCKLGTSCPDKHVSWPCCAGGTQLAADLWDGSCQRITLLPSQPARNATRAGGLWHEEQAPCLRLCGSNGVHCFNAQNTPIDTLSACRLQKASRDPVCLWWIASNTKLGQMLR